MVGRCRLLVACAGLALAALGTSVPSASAACRLFIDGREVSLEGTPDQAITVSSPGQAFVVEGEAGSPGDPYQVTLDYFGVPVPLATGTAGPDAAYRFTVRAEGYGWVGVGRYRLVGTTDGPEGCRAVVYAQIQGAPLATVPGLAAAVVIAAGLTLVLGSAFAIWRAGSRGPGPRDDASRGPQPTPAASDRLQQLRTISERAQSSRAARAAGAPTTGAVALRAFGGKALVTERIDAAAGLPPVDVYELILERPMDAEMRSTLVGLGIEILSSIPPSTYRVVLTEVEAAQVLAMDPVVGLCRYGLDQTVSVAALDEAAAAPPDSAPRVFDCLVHRETDLEGILAAVDAAADIELVSQGRDVVRISAPPGSAAVAELADRLDVRRLITFEPPELLSDHGRLIIGADRVVPTDDGPVRGWTGDGELVAVFDSGIDAQHPDLMDRIASATAAVGHSAIDERGHGTLVSGIVAGTGAASGGTVRGVAPGARLVSHAIVDKDGQWAIPPDLGDLLATAVEHGAHIVNLSWSTSATDDYDSGGSSIDRFVVEHPDVLVVIAAGNSGRAPDGHHALRTLTSPGSAKNALTVGASDTDRVSDPPIRWGSLYHDQFPKAPAADESASGDPDLPAAISSRGPTTFHTLKPELVAPGTFVRSARSSTFDQKLRWREDDEFDGRYVYGGGTSFSAPFVAGAAAVVRQYLRATFGLEPSAALLKAVLIGSTRPLPSRRRRGSDGAVGHPDFDQGFGCLDLRTLFDVGARPVPLRVVDVPNGAPEALDARPAHGSPNQAMATYEVDVGAGRPLRATLAWTDPPGLHVQNNLELEVRGPADRWSGNGDFTYLSGPLAKEPPGIEYDKRNNVEQVVLTEPDPGRYQIRILAERCAFPPQGYALALIGALTSDLDRVSTRPRDG